MSEMLRLSVIVDSQVWPSLYLSQATKSVFHATISGYSSYYGCNHMVTVRITDVTIWLQTVVRL